MSDQKSADFRQIPSRNVSNVKAEYGRSPSDSEAAMNFGGGDFGTPKSSPFDSQSTHSKEQIPGQRLSKKKRSLKGKGPASNCAGLSDKTKNIIFNLEGAATHSAEEEDDDEKSLAEEEKMEKESKIDMTIRILMLGDSGVGKTSLMLRYTDDRFSPNLLSTAGVDFKVLNLNINGKKVRCQIWDTAGQEKFHVITRAYYKGAQGIVLVYDISDADSFKNVNYWMANIQTHAPPAGREGIHKVLLGNKKDLSDELREVQFEEGEEVANEYKIDFHEVSAKDGSDVSKAFNSLAREIVKGIEADAEAASGAGGGGSGIMKFGGRLTHKVTHPTKSKPNSNSPNGSGSEKCSVI